MGAFCRVQGMADNQQGVVAADIQEGGVAAGIQEGVVAAGIQEGGVAGHMAVHTQLEALSALHTQQEAVAGHKRGWQAGHNQQEAVGRHMAGHKQGEGAGHTEEQALVAVDSSTPEAAGSIPGLGARQDCVVPRAGAFPVGA
jgi:hypothetical protein